ncbi:hypothetical protein H6P81_014911 [Aristolochia fimbriata]|uniref:Cytochrome P450 n=1 Tax=Aristolochia fimbriata TaxID=158543 RepID=A0AAV7E5C3_ARIFI|nr:hypothetical protein H6P81_014911 [Aristolochia fimbriata]
MALMSTLASSLLFFSFLVMTLFMVIKNGTKRKTSTAPGTTHYKQLPGPSKLPIIGSMHHLISSASKGRSTAQALRDLAYEHGPLMHLQLGEIPTLVVTSIEAAKEILKTHDQNFAYRPLMPTMRYHTYEFKDMMMAPYGAYWRQIRKICVVEVLSAKRVESFRFIREEEMLNLMQAVSTAAEAKSPVNLTGEMYSAISNVLARAAFGDTNRAHAGKFVEASKEMLKFITGSRVEHIFPSWSLLRVVSGLESKLKEIHGRMDRIVNDIVEEHRHKSSNIVTSTNINGQEHEDSDFVDVLLRLQNEGDFEVPLTIDTIKALIVDIFMGGSDTSSVVTIWAISELMKNPEERRKAQAEVRQVFGENSQVQEADLHKLKYLKAVVKETLRLHPPLPLLFPRESKQKCEIMGYEIPARTQVFVNVWAMGREPKYWGEDAEQFKPERFLDTNTDYRGTDFEYLPFGAGRRICPGITLGIRNVELPLACLLYYFNWELPGGMKPEELDMSEDDSAIVGRKTDLCLTPIPYYPLKN